MNLATVLFLTAILEVAAACAGWMGGLTFAVCRPAPGAPAWRHAAATFGSVGLAVLAYFAALVALGQGAVLSGQPDRAPTAAGLLLLAAVFGLGAGLPWGLFRHAGARSASGEIVDDGESVWTVARQTSARLFLPFAILGLVAFAPRARGDVSGTAGAIVAGALAVVVVAAVVAAVAIIAFRHLGAILKLAALGALVGVPLVTALMALSGVPLAESFTFSAASALVWAPVFGLAAWGVTGMHEAGFGIRRDFLVEYTGSAPVSGARTKEPPGAPAERHPPQRTRRRNRRR